MGRQSLLARDRGALRFSLGSTTCSWAASAAMALTLAAVGGCAGRNAEPDLCANGACEGLVDCELGICDEEDDPLAGRTKSTHSLAAGVTHDNVSASCPFTAEEVPSVDALLDDSSIPEFRRNRARTTNHQEGQGFLQDYELHEHLLSVQGALFECLDLAACYDLEAAGTGELDFQFELEPDGRVSAVSVSPSDEIDQPIVRACARRSVFESQFPSWNGSRMVVNYSVQISEGAI